MEKATDRDVDVLTIGWKRGFYVPLLSAAAAVVPGVKVIRDVLDGDMRW